MDDKEPDSALYRDSFQARILRGTDLIEIKVRGYSQTSAKNFADATIDNLKKTHDEMAASAVQSVRHALERTDRELARVTALRDKLVKITDLKDKAGLMENIVLTNNIVMLGNELRVLEQAKTDYEQQLGPTHTYPTSYMERTSLSDKPVAPKKVQIILIAGVLGLFAGAVVAFLDHAWARKAVGNGV